MDSKSEQKEGIVKSNDDEVGYLYFDPMGIASFADLVACMAKRVAPAIRKRGLEYFLSKNEHKTFIVQGGKVKANIYVMQGAQYNERELHVAEKLTKAGFHVLFPCQGDLGRGRKHDVMLYEVNTYIQHKVELKSLFGSTAETVKQQLISGSNQARKIAYDIQSNIKKSWLIEGLRSGWSNKLKVVLLNYKGQWYQLGKKEVFSETIYKILK